MEANCPHLGADMSHADIEEYDEHIVAVCPWHRFAAWIHMKCYFLCLCRVRYDFDLRTGKSETGLKACTYSVEVKTDALDGIDKVFIETPDGTLNWRLVELRPVSEGSRIRSQMMHTLSLVCM